MQELNLLDSLIENDSILLNQEAKNWKEAIEISIYPLVKSKSVDKIYIENVIAQTKKNGPYYIISKNVAMPHARPEDGVKKNCFSLVTFKKPIKFKNDDREIKVLIALGATSADIHLSFAIPQIVAIFEKEETTKLIIEAKTKEQIISILKNIDFSKYIN